MPAAGPSAGAGIRPRPFNSRITCSSRMRKDLQPS
jgi:hypothetical protein